MEFTKLILLIDVIIFQCYDIYKVTGNFTSYFTGYNKEKNRKQEE